MKMVGGKRIGFCDFLFDRDIIKASYNGDKNGKFYKGCF